VVGWRHGGGDLVVGDVGGDEQLGMARAREGQEERELAAREGHPQVVAAEGDRHTASSGARRGGDRGQAGLGLWLRLAGADINESRRR